MPGDDLLLRLGLALAIGFLIGLERGWKERDEAEGRRTAGLRTYSLIALLGGVFGALTRGDDFLLLAAGFVMVSGTLAAFFWREGVSEDDFSATSVVAAMLTFMLRLNSIAFGEPRGSLAPAQASYVPLYTHLALVFVAGIYLPPPLVVWFQNVARLLG